jgi:voltage-gated anion channel
LRFGSTAVMASGIVSLDLHDRGWDTASRVVLAVAAAAWLWAWATADVAQRVAGVAATAALGSRLLALGWRAVAWGLLAVAAAIWIGRLPKVLGRERGRSGSLFLPAVATQSLAVLAASLGAPAAVAVALWLGGLALYGRAFTRFDRRELREGAGEHWVAGGALAISTLACAELAHRLSGLRVPAVVLWTCALAWLVALVTGELVNPRRGGVPERWSTAFPVGMYAAMTFALARLHGLHWVEPFARGWTVVAAVVWALVLSRAVCATAR